MRRIPLTKGKFALVSDEDYEELKKYKWNCSTRGYAVRREKRESGWVDIKMASQIMGFPRGKYVDHIDRNKLNNVRSNLRLATKAENCQNRKLIKEKKYQGCSFDKSLKQWVVRICKGGKSRKIACCRTAKEAARWYDAAAREYFGEFAYLNFPNKKIPLKELQEKQLREKLKKKYAYIDFVPQAKKWRARMRWKNADHHFGYFDNKADAAECLHAARQILFPIPA